MAINDYLKTHRTWQDGLELFLGMTIGLSPYITGEASNIAAVLNAALSGLAILLIAQLELVRLRRWEEVLEAMFGLWVVVSPFVFLITQVSPLKAPSPGSAGFQPCSGSTGASRKINGLASS